ncbi:MAG: hypothetical protein JW954_01560 [Dehalococcoidaceae bacterium]|nr:hypothetical protein [Dehalococcoidaceae bacterium]
MIEQNEIIMLVLGIGVLVFIRLSLCHLRQIPAFRILIGSFGAVVAGFAFTVLEGIYWESLFNLLEHISYMTSSLLLLAWCFLVFIRKENSRP